MFRDRRRGRDSSRPWNDSLENASRSATCRADGFGNLHIATVLKGLEARRVSFPAWVLAYRYRDRLFRTVLSGQDAACLRGEAPYSAARIAAVVAGAVAAALVLLAVIAI